ncbi:hypothetical protein M2138_000743 [Dysgonomonadaceae bacterium PH5-43]|nr:hypothetical protein [Dysgonomonadaceae bacterium PH5-43]
MALQYTVQAKKNPRKPGDPEKYYIVSSSLGQIDFEKLIVEASEETTLNADELRLGLNLVFKKAIERLEEGHTVRLANIGLMGLRVNSLGSDSPEEVSVAKNVKDIKPYLAFDSKIRARLKQTKLKKKA